MCNPNWPEIKSSIFPGEEITIDDMINSEIEAHERHILFQLHHLPANEALEAEV